MAKIIKLRQEHIDQCVADLIKQSDERMPEGQLEFKRVFEVKDRKARLLFTPNAWIKMNILLDGYESEIGWYGVASRLGDEEKDEYLIEDIVVYPQEVGAANVEMADPPVMTQWRLSHIEDEKYDRLYAHGHSHVRMSTGPSGVDLGHQRDILKEMQPEGFYIFMIWNKRLEHWLRIYDLKKNIQFEDKDISLGFYEEDTDYDTFMDDAKAIAKPYVYKPKTAVGVSVHTAGTPAAPAPKTQSLPPAQGSNAAPVQGMGWQGKDGGRGGGVRYLYDDYDDEYWDPTTGQWVDGDTYRWMQRSQYYM